MRKKSDLRASPVTGGAFGRSLGPFPTDLDSRGAGKSTREAFLYAKKTPMPSGALGSGKIFRDSFWLGPDSLLRETKEKRGREVITGEHQVNNSDIRNPIITFTNTINITTILK